MRPIPRQNILIGLVLTLALSGCGDSAGPDDLGELELGMDAGVSEDAGFIRDAATMTDAESPDCCTEVLRSGPCQSPEAPILRGGAAGGPLSGELLVHVIDSYDGTPRPGALVRLDAPERIEGMTDETGCVQFTGAVLRSFANVSVFERGRSFVTLFGQTRRELTVLTLDPTVTPPFVLPPSASVSGVVTNLEVLTATSLTSSKAVARIADLRPITKVFTGGPPSGLTRPGYPSIPRARAYVGPLSPTTPTAIDFTDVSTVFDPSDVLGFWLDGGTQESDPSGARANFPTHLGVYRALRPAAGENPTGLEFELDIPREETLSIRAGAIPNIFTNKLYLPFVSFPDDNGIIEMGTSRPYVGPTTVSVPALTGSLQGAVYGALLIASGRMFPGPALRLVLRSQNPSIDFGNTPSPPRVSVDGRVLRFDIDQDGGSMVLVTITRNDRVLWLVRVLEPRRLNFEVDLADVPGGLDDLLAGEPTEVQVSLFRFESGVSAHEVDWFIPEMERRTVLFATDTINARF